MTDEEKNAIKDCDSIFICLDDAMSEGSANYYRKSYKILKNLIEKQQKEIEEGYSIDNYISKDKIKAKIEEYRHKDFIKMQVVWKHDKEALKIVEVLQSLLEKE